jgi:hypothetical protein
MEALHALRHGEPGAAEGRRRREQKRGTEAFLPSPDVHQGEFDYARWSTHRELRSSTRRHHQIL